MRLQFITCCKKTWLVGVDGKNISNATMSGGQVEGTPFLAVGNDELRKAPPIPKTCPCPICGKQVKVESSEESEALK